MNINIPVADSDFVHRTKKNNSVHQKTGTFLVFLCDKCGKVFDENYHKITNYYLQNFPKYGLEKKTCKFCEAEK